jgi:hypothetical protein
MKLTPGKTVLLASVLLTALQAAEPKNPLGNVKDVHATDFTQEQYYEPPFDQQVHVRLSGSQAEPLPGGLLDVRQLKAEILNTNGTPQVVILAPQCTFAPLDNAINSPGHLEILSGDGLATNGWFRLEGEGFLVLQTGTNYSVTISNRVRTVIQFPRGVAGKQISL